MAVQTPNLMKKSLLMEPKTKELWQWIELVRMAPMAPATDVDFYPVEQENLVLMYLETI